MDVLIIGGGANGLVAAFYLAKAGFKPLVLERRDVVGGGAVTGEIAPGFRCPTLAHTVGPLRPSVLRDMDLERQGVTFVHPEPQVFAPAPDGRAVLFHRDVARTAHGLVNLSSHDAATYPQFAAALQRLGRFLASMFESTPPSLDRPTSGELWELLQAGRRFRKLERADGFRLLRWIPMAVADLVAEWFETDLVQAAIAARGIFGTAMGPWSAGTGAVLLWHAATDPQPAGGTVTVRGGPGALASALRAAAEGAGARVRTGAAVSRILIQDDAASGVVLEGGEQLPARAVVSAVDPRRTFLGLIDPVDLDPDFAGRMRNYRSMGTVAKVNLALAGLPSFTAAPNGSLEGRIHIGPDIDSLERAFDASKYGKFSEDPFLDVTIPSLADPTLAPAGQHVMSVAVQFAPYHLRGTDWDARQRVLADTVVRTLAAYAPGIDKLVLERQVITPRDLETEYGYTGGHIFHGEIVLDQLFTMRPVLGAAQYRAPIRQLYLCGSGTHPGGGITGGSGHNAAREIARDLRRGRGRKDMTRNEE
jgi:phytoene dehydrogenase-like protein